MESKNVFLEVSRRRLRFPAEVGSLTVEDLWDLSLKRIDGIYKSLKAAKNRLENTSGESLFKNDENDPVVSRQLEEVEIQIQVVTQIFNIKREEAAVVQAQADRDEKKRKLVAALAMKEDEELRSMSKEDLLKQIQEL